MRSCWDAATCAALSKPCRLEPRHGHVQRGLAAGGALEGQQHAARLGVGQQLQRWQVDLRSSTDCAADNSAGRRLLSIQELMLALA
jgi:hypothetical protein